MGTRSFGALGALLLLVAAAPLLAQQAPPGYYQAPPQYQPPPQYQQPPPQYQQPPPQYQPPPPQYQQPPPQYQQQPPQYEQPPPQYPPPAAPPGYYQPPPPTYSPPPPATQAAATYSQPGNTFRYHALRMELAGGYTLTEGTLKDTLNDGGNVGLGFIWMPSSSFPLGLRLEGSYSDFSHTQSYLAQESAATGYNLSSGYTALYGGNVDAELDLPMTPRAHEYLFGGIGWYRQQSNLKAVTNQQGLICYYYCVPVTFQSEGTVERITTPWQKSWNAGIGFEFAMADPGSFFIEARYMRITQNQGSAQTAFIPIRVGIRF
jgi:Outer membrane protein beta-barrel domain